jgi:hypothetical protein
MGRSRKDGDPFALAGTRLAWKHGAFYYRHRDGRWERIGADVTVAKSRAALYNDPTGVYGTVGYWLDMFLVDCAARVQMGTLAQRTLSDYTKNVVELKPYFGSSLPEHLEPQHIQTYLDEGMKAGRPVRANREIACLSSCLSWMMRNGHTTLAVNPCMQKSGTKGNSESKRERYVTDEEYLAAFTEAGTQVRLLMELTYRTLQRPESDIIHWQSTVFTKDPHTGHRVISFKQGKTGVQIKIAMTKRLEVLAAQAIGTIPKLHQPVLHIHRDHVHADHGDQSGQPEAGEGWQGADSTIRLSGFEGEGRHRYVAVRDTH